MLPAMAKEKATGTQKIMAGLLELIRARCTKGLVEALTAIVPEYIPGLPFLRHAA
jgi:hypothetical protein